ncbi:unnamed protein product, partial [Ixodes pacificus]
LLQRPEQSPRTIHTHGNGHVRWQESFFRSAEGRISQVAARSGNCTEGDGGAREESRQDTGTVTPVKTFVPTSLASAFMPWQRSPRFVCQCLRRWTGLDWPCIGSWIE